MLSGREFYLEKQYTSMDLQNRTKSFNYQKNVFYDKYFQKHLSIFSFDQNIQLGQTLSYGIMELSQKQGEVFFRIPNLCIKLID